jgi:hypothetical protein
MKWLLRASVLAGVMAFTLLVAVPALAQLNWMSWDLAILWFLSSLIDGGLRPPWC